MLVLNSDSTLQSLKSFHIILISQVPNAGDSGQRWRLNIAVLKGCRSNSNMQPTMKIIHLDISDKSEYNLEKNYFKTKAFTSQHLNDNFIILLPQTMIFYEVFFQVFCFLFICLFFLVIYINYLYSLDTSPFFDVYIEFFDIIIENTFFSLSLFQFFLSKNRCFKFRWSPIYYVLVDFLLCVLST